MIDPTAAYNNIRDYMVAPLGKVTKFFYEVKNRDNAFVKSCQLVLACVQTYWYFSGVRINPNTEKGLDSIQLQYGLTFLGLINTLLGRVNSDSVSNKPAIQNALKDAFINLGYYQNNNEAGKIAEKQIEKIFKDRCYRNEADFFHSLQFNVKELLGDEKKAENVIRDIVERQQIKVLLKPAEWSNPEFYLKNFQSLFFEIGNIQVLLIYLREWGVDIQSISRAIGEVKVFSFLVTYSLDTLCTVSFILGYGCGFALALFDLSRATDAQKAIKSIWDASVSATEIALLTLSLTQIDRGVFLIYTIVTKSIGVGFFMFKVARGE